VRLICLWGTSIAHRSFVFGAFDRSTEAREAVCVKVVRQGVRIPSGALISPAFAR